MCTKYPIQCGKSLVKGDVKNAIKISLSSSPRTLLELQCGKEAVISTPSSWLYNRFRGIIRIRMDISMAHDPVTPFYGTMRCTKRWDKIKCINKVQFYKYRRKKRKEKNSDPSWKFVRFWHFVSVTADEWEQSVMVVLPTFLTTPAPSVHTCDVTVQSLHCEVTFLRILVVCISTNRINI